MGNDELHASFHLIGMIIDDLWCRSFLIPAHLEKPTSWITTWNVVPFQVPKNKRLHTKLSIPWVWPCMATPFLVIVNTRIFTCLVGNPFKSSFVTVSANRTIPFFWPKKVLHLVASKKMHPNQNWQISRGDRITHNTTTLPWVFFVPCKHHHHHLYAQKKAPFVFSKFSPAIRGKLANFGGNFCVQPIKTTQSGERMLDVSHVAPSGPTCYVPWSCGLPSGRLDHQDGSGKSFPNRKIEGFKTSTAAANLGPEQWEGSLSKEKRCEISCSLQNKKHCNGLLVRDCLVVDA